MIKSWMDAFLQAATTCSWVAFRLAILTFSSILSWNSTVSCSTKLSAARSDAVLMPLMFSPEISTCPKSVSQNRMSSLSSVDLPLPLRPVMPMTEFCGTSSDTSFKITSLP